MYQFIQFYYEIVHLFFYLFIKFFYLLIYLFIKLFYFFNYSKINFEPTLKELFRYKGYQLLLHSFHSGV